MNPGRLAAAFPAPIRTVANKALGRDLGDLLSRARPSRLVARFAPGAAPEPVDPHPAPGGSDPASPAADPGDLTPSPMPQELPLTAPSVSTSPEPALASEVFPSRPSAHRPVPSRFSATGHANPYRPAPSAPTPLASWTFIVLDFLCLGLAAILAFTDIVDRPMSTVLAILAVSAGACCGTLGYLLRPVRPAPAEAPKVRVHLHRV